MSDRPAFVCRPARRGDLAAVDDVLSASYPALLSLCYARDVLDAALPYMVKANPALLASGTCYVVEGDAGSLLGCGGWTKTPPGGGPEVDGEAHLRHFATRPEATRRGVGTCLLERCVADARASGIRRFLCQSTLYAERFYRASGFVAIGRLDVPMGAMKMPCVLMSLDLYARPASGARPKDEQ